MTAPDTPPPAPYRAPDLAAECASLRAEVARLRAIIDGRDVAPTDAEIDAHAAVGGLWVIHTPHGIGRGGFTATTSDPDKARGYLDRAKAYPGTRWIALADEGRPCPWPVVPAADGARP